MTMLAERHKSDPEAIQALRAALNHALRGKEEVNEHILACLLARGHLHDEEHIGHVIPAHKPRSFPRAVSRCRELNNQISETVAHGNPNPSIDLRLLSVALDIANWLPEIAAASDMPASPWNEVHARAADLANAYETVRRGGSLPEVRTAIKQANASIVALESLVGSADSRWFDEPKQLGQEAAPQSSGPSPTGPSSAQGS